jgi:ADP-heptose:LPS heptosyltransferase
MLNGNQRVGEVYKNCPWIDSFIPYIDDTFNFEQFPIFWAALKKETGCDKYINFTQSLEVNLAVHPETKEYYTKKWYRKKRCNKNYYEETAKWAKVTVTDFKPQVFLHELDESRALQILNPKKFNLVWCVNGSGPSKLYPWTPSIIDEVFRAIPEINIITIGDAKSIEMEKLIDDRCIKLSGKIPFMTSVALTKYADLTISVDTGILHAAGCFNKPKIAILGHTSRENITKHFTNCYTFEAKVPCSPCFSMIYDKETQKCPIDEVTGAVACMGGGVDPNEIYKKIIEIYERNYKHSLIGGIKNGAKNSYN